MKPHLSLRHVVATLAIAAACCVSGCDHHRSASGDSHNQHMVAEAWIPEPARQSLVKHADGEIKTVTTSTSADGKTVYVATVERGDAYSALTVDGDGDVVSDRPTAAPPALAVRRADEATSRPVALDALPEPARKTVLGRVKAEEIRRIDQAQVNDRIVYDVVADHAGAVTRLSVDADGRVVSERTAAEERVAVPAERVAIDRVPERPRTVILEQTHGAAIRDIRSDTIDGRVVYTVQVDRNEYINDFIVDRDGHLLTSMRVVRRMAVGDVPAAPRTTLVQMSDGGVIRVVEHAVDEDRELYTAVVDRAVVDKLPRTSRITVDRLGYLVSRRKVEKQIDLDELVNPSLAAVKEHAHERTVESIEQQNDSGRTLYEVRLAGEGPTLVRVTEAGDVVKY
jgi:uncharacterized membrane protein YkoI